jgi:hypothetical protein
MLHWPLQHIKQSTALLLRWPTTVLISSNPALLLASHIPPLERHARHAVIPHHLSELTLWTKFLSAITSPLTSSPFAWSFSGRFYQSHNDLKQDLVPPSMTYSINDMCIFQLTLTLQSYALHCKMEKINKNCRNTNLPHESQIHWVGVGARFAGVIDLLATLTKRLPLLGWLALHPLG